MKALFQDYIISQMLVFPISSCIVIRLVLACLGIHGHMFYFPFHIYFIYLFGVLCHFQHCTGHITMGSWKGRGNQYIQFVRVLYCKLPTIGKQLPAFPLEAMPGIEPRPQRWEASVTTLPPWPPFPHSKINLQWCK